MDLYLECIKIDDRDIMLKKLMRIYNYSFNNLNFNSKNFCLRFEKRCLLELIFIILNIAVDVYKSIFFFE